MLSNNLLGFFSLNPILAKNIAPRVIFNLSLTFFLVTYSSTLSQKERVIISLFDNPICIECYPSIQYVRLFYLISLSVSNILTSVSGRLSNYIPPLNAESLARGAMRVTERSHWLKSLSPLSFETHHSLR